MINLVCLFVVVFFTYKHSSGDQSCLFVCLFVVVYFTYKHSSDDQSCLFVRCCLFYLQTLV